MIRTVWTLAAVCLIQFLFATFVMPTDSMTHAIFMLATDSIACAVITWRPAGRWQSVIGLSFILQIGAHIGRIGAELLGRTADVNVYWWGLTLLAYLQLILIGGWWIHGRLGYPRWGRNNPRAFAPRVQGMEK